MKKTNYFLATTLVAMIALFSACQQQTKKDSDKSTKPLPVETAAVCYENNGRPGNMLTYKEIVGMLTQYDKTRTDILKKVTPDNVEDTRINTYDIKQLRDYLAYIEDLCKEKNIELTAINVISSAYPENYVKKEYANKQTLIYMPVTKINGENVTFDPLQSKKGQPATFKQLLADYNYDWKYDARKIEVTKTQKAGIFSLGLQEDKESSGANRNTMIPPPYNQ